MGRGEADFFVTFGSDAVDFSKRTKSQLAGAREAINALRQDLQTLYDDSRGGSPSLAQGLIAELQEATGQAAKLRTELTSGIRAMGEELNRVLSQMRNMKPIEVRIKGVTTGVTARSNAGAVRDEVAAVAETAVVTDLAGKTRTARRQTASRKQAAAEEASVKGVEEAAAVTAASAKASQARATRTQRAAAKKAQAEERAVQAAEQSAQAGAAQAGKQSGSAAKQAAEKIDKALAAHAEQSAQRIVEGVRLQAPGGVLTGRNEEQLREVLTSTKPNSGPASFNRILDKIGYGGGRAPYNTKTGENVAIAAILKTQQTLPEAAPLASATKDAASAVKNQTKAVKEVADSGKVAAASLQKVAASSEELTAVSEEVAYKNNQLAAIMRDNLSRELSPQLLSTSLAAIVETETPAIRKARRDLKATGVRVQLEARGAEPIRRPTVVDPNDVGLGRLSGYESDLPGKIGSVIPTPTSIRSGRPEGRGAITGGIASDVVRGPLNAGQVKAMQEQTEAELRRFQQNYQAVAEADAAQQRTAFQEAGRILAVQPGLDIFGRAPVNKPRKPTTPGERASQEERSQYQDEYAAYRVQSQNYRQAVQGWRRLQQAVKELDVMFAEEANEIDRLRSATGQDTKKSVARLARAAKTLGVTPEVAEQMINLGAVRHASTIQRQAEIQESGATVVGRDRERVISPRQSDIRALNSATLDYLFGQRTGLISTGLDPSKTRFAGRDDALTAILPGGTSRGFTRAAFNRQVAELGESPGSPEVVALQNEIFGVKGGRGRKPKAGLLGIGKKLRDANAALDRYVSELEGQGLDVGNLPAEEAKKLAGKVKAADEAMAKWESQLQRVADQNEKAFGERLQPVSGAVAKQRLAEGRAATKAREAAAQQEVVGQHATTFDDAKNRAEEIGGKTSEQIAALARPSAVGAIGNECCERIVTGLNEVRDAVVALGEKGVVVKGLSAAASQGRLTVGPEAYTEGSREATQRRIQELQGKDTPEVIAERARLQEQIAVADRLVAQGNRERQSRATDQSQRAAAAGTATTPRRTRTLASLEDLPPEIQAQVQQALAFKTSRGQLPRLAQAAVNLRDNFGIRKDVAENQVFEAAGFGSATSAANSEGREKLRKATTDLIVSNEAEARASSNAARATQKKAEAAQVLSERDRIIAQLDQYLAPATQSWIAELNRLRSEAERLLNTEKSVPLELRSQIRNAQVEVTRGLGTDLSRRDQFDRVIVPSSERLRSINTVVGATGAERDTINAEATARNVASRFGNAALQDAPQFNSKFMQAAFGTTGLSGRIISASSHAAARFFGYGLVFGITNELSKVFRASLQTEAEFVRISDALNATGRSAGNLRGQLQGISSSLATPLEEVYTTAAQLTGVFQNTQDVVFATKAVEQLKLISRGALDAQEAISSLQAISSAYGTTGGSGFQQIVDKATAIQNFTGANIEQLVEGAGGIAPQAAQFHLSQTQALLYPGLIAQRTNQSGGAAAEQLSRIFESLTGAAAQTFLTQQHIATPRQIRSQDFGDIINNLITRRAHDQLSDSQITSLEQIVGARQARSLSALIGTQGQAQQTLRGSAAAGDSTGAGTRRVQQLMQQLNRQFQQLSVNLTNIGASIARSGLLVGLASGVRYLNEMLRILGQISDLVKSLGRIPILGGAIGDLAKLGVLYGTVKVARGVIGTGVGALQGFIRSRTEQATGPVAASLAGPGGEEEALRPSGLLGPAGTPLAASRAAEDDAKLEVRARQAAIRAQSLEQLAESTGYQRPSILRQPGIASIRLASGPATLGARILDGPALTVGSKLSGLTTPFDRVNRLTDSMGSRFTRLGESMTRAGASLTTMEASIVGLTEESSLAGRFAGAGAALGNVALLALPLALAGLQGRSSQQRGVNDYYSSVFPNAGAPVAPPDRAAQAQSQGQQALQQVVGAQNSVSGRISSGIGFVLHGLGGIVSSHQRQLQQTDANALNGGSNANVIGTPVVPEQFRRQYQIATRFDPNGLIAKAFGPSSAAIPLNKAVQVSDNRIIADLKGLQDKSKTIAQINTDIDNRANELKNDPSLTSAQKVAAGADLEHWRQVIQKIYVSTQEKLQGIIGINQLTSDQAAAFGGILSSGLSLPGTLISSGIGKQLFNTVKDQLSPTSRLSYLTASLYGATESAPNSPTFPGQGDVRPNLQQLGRYRTSLDTLSPSQQREQQLLGGNNPRTALGRLGIEQKISSAYKTDVLTPLVAQVNADISKGDQGEKAFQTDSTALNNALAQYSQLQQDVAQGTVQTAEAMADILSGQGKPGQAAQAIQSGIAKINAALHQKGVTPGSAEYISLVTSRNQLQRDAADQAAQPAIDAASLAGAQSLDPQVQAQAQLRAAQIQLGKLKLLHSLGRGGVKPSEIKQAGIAVAQAYQGIVAQADSVAEAQAQIGVAEARNPTSRIAAELNAANVQLGHAHGAAAKAQALASIIDLQNQAADNAESIMESASALMEARERDPFKKIQDSISNLKQQIAYAESLGDTQRANELKAQLVQAQHDASDLMSQSIQANYSLLIAVATAAGQTIKAARLAYRQAQEAYQQAVKDNGGNKNAPDVKNAKAAVVAARANIRDTYVQQREDDLQFQYDMGRISLQTYEAQLKQLLKLKDLTKAQRHQIQETLHQLALSNQGQFNFGDIKLPTPYEVRRLLSVGTRPGKYQSSYGLSGSVGNLSPGQAAASHITHNHNNIRFYGADEHTIRKIIHEVLGPESTSRQTTRTRKVG